MRDVKGLLAAVLLLLVGRSSGVEPSRGSCIGNECHSVTHEPIDFHAAQQWCANRSGNLMTVRSTSSNDILNELLRASTPGRFWIGLWLESGCPDPTAKLRGFKWVTGDMQSDFSNWELDSDDSCSSPSCVSVSIDSGSRWSPQPCEEEVAGFLCEFGINDPCVGLQAAEKPADTYMYVTLQGFGGADLTVLPPGSTATRLSSEEKFLCANEKWLPAPWTCEILEGGCEHKCATDPNQQSACYCPPGQTVNPSNKLTCEVGQDDPCLALQCAHACYSTGDTYACTCDHGYKLAADGRSCVDFNDCKDQRQCPDENSVCVNTEGGFECACRPGFKAAGEHCVDVDECMSAPCEHMCSNTVGGYECSCFSGYVLDTREPHKCKQHCGEAECVALCDPNNALQCTCPVGYISEVRDSTTYCIDIDECESNFCDMSCRNTYGGYVCKCPVGFDLVNEYMCVPNEDYVGYTTTSTFTSPASLPRPEPTRRPSGVSVGAFVGIILCTVFFVVLLVFLAHHVLSRRGKINSAATVAAKEDEAHGLRRVDREP